MSLSNPFQYHCAGKVLYSGGSALGTPINSKYGFTLNIISTGVIDVMFDVVKV